MARKEPPEAISADEPMAPASKARGIFPNQGMHANAEFIASLHTNAVEYLEQAPALTCCFGAKYNTKADRLYIASRIGGPIERGERLRAVMAAACVAYPLRKLAGSAIEPSTVSIIRDLGKFDPSTLSQIIPAKAGRQKTWLRGLRGFRDRLRVRGADTPHFNWVARQTSLVAVEPVVVAGAADFISQHPNAPIEAWGWARLVAEIDLWHDRLASEQGLWRLPGFIKPDTQIDLSDWPDTDEVDGFEFFKLTTPVMIWEEGRRQRHCVGSYIPDVLSGKTSLFSIRQDMRRVATLQIMGKRVVQLKGFANKAVSPAIQKAAQHFTSKAA